MVDICVQGLIIGIFTMMAYHIGLTKGSNGAAMTMAFSTLCLARLFHGFNCRGKNQYSHLDFSVINLVGWHLE